MRQKGALQVIWGLDGPCEEAAAQRAVCHYANPKLPQGWDNLSLQG